MFETTLAFLIALASAGTLFGLYRPDIVAKLESRFNEKYDSFDAKEPHPTWFVFAASATAWFSDLVNDPPAWLRPAAVIGLAIGLSGIFFGGSIWFTLVGAAVAAATWWPEKFDRFGGWNFTRWEQARFIGIVIALFGFGWWIDSATFEAIVVIGAAAYWYADRQGWIAKAVEKAKPWVASISDADLHK